MLNIILGLCMLCLGILGVVWNWWAVVDLVTVVIPLLLVFWCLPPIVFASERARAEIDARHDALVRANDQAAGRRPASPLTSRGR